MLILGISGLYHDSSAALLENGNIIAAAQEERFTRIKNDASVPVNAIQYCLDFKNIKLSEVDAVVYYDNPMDTLDRFLCNVLAAGDNSKDLIDFQFDSLFSKRLWVHKFLKNKFGVISKMDQLLVAQHHYSHAASAFFPSRFKDAAILTLDGVGEWNTTTIGAGHDNQIKILKKIDYPHSLGMLYSAFTYYCGFKVNSGEYKLMGLAPYGEPIYRNTILNELVDVKPDGSFRLNLEYFDYQYGRSMINEKFEQLFRGSRRLPETTITKREMDLAASIQSVTEEIVVRLAKTAAKITGEHKNLVMAGGIALNCVANGRLQREKIFKNIWIQPAAGDAGGAIGAAYLGYYIHFGQKRRFCIDNCMNYSYLGPEFTDRDANLLFKKVNAVYHYYDNVTDVVAKLLTEGKIIGLFQGRMEFGPRALGCRSIIAEARDPEMQTKLNLKIKFRESFRPFAPAVLEEHVSEYFEMAGISPYMLFCSKVKTEIQESYNLQDILYKNQYDMLTAAKTKKSAIPAVTHVDYSARIQTVSREANPQFWAMINSYYNLTGCAVLVNTSFNVRGEPIVCTPEDAFTCFMRTEMDCLVLNNFILYKEEQQVYREKTDWRLKYELD